MNLVPLDNADLVSVSELLDDELEAWRTDLGWDYSPVRKILFSFMARRALPGFVAMDGSKAVGYTYFLFQQQKGIIGTVYGARTAIAGGVADLLQQAAIDALRDASSITRIESQIVPFRDVDLAPCFLGNGFECWPRHFLELDFGEHMPRGTARDARILPWELSNLSDSARIAFAGYRGQVDALICEDYRTERGCEGYLRSLTETPGCGTYLPADSWVAIDNDGILCGFILVSRIASSKAMIPQVSVLPSHQGRGIGKALMGEAFASLRMKGYCSVALTVTAANLRAHEWYTRLGFQTRKAFSAAVWQRG